MVNIVDAFIFNTVRRNLLSHTFISPFSRLYLSDHHRYLEAYTDYPLLLSLSLSCLSFFFQHEPSSYCQYYSITAPSSTSYSTQTFTKAESTLLEGLAEQNCRSEMSSFT